MLSSRPHQHHLYVDKENVLSLPVHPLTTARKGSASYTSTQASAFLAAKTPGLKQSLQQGAARTVNRNGSTIKSVSKGASGPQTTAVEQGARILGAKDGNNRQRVAQTVAKEKNTGKAGDVVDCGEMAPKVLFKDVLTRSDNNVVPSRSNNSLALKAGAKTPARQIPIKTSFKTPGMPTARKLQQPATQQRLALYKTPSPNFLNRRRKGGASPVLLDFQALVKPTSLCADGHSNVPNQVVLPTPEEIFQANLDKIDEEQEVEKAGRSIHPLDLPYQPDFPIPDYKKLALGMACFFPGSYGNADPLADIVPSLDNPEDRAVIDDEIYWLDTREELPDPPLFPQLAIEPGNSKGTSAPSFAKRPSSSFTSQYSFNSVRQQKVNPREIVSKNATASTRASPGIPGTQSARSHSPSTTSSSKSQKKRVTGPFFARRPAAILLDNPEMDVHFKLEALEFEL